MQLSRRNHTIAGISWQAAFGHSRIALLKTLKSSPVLSIEKWVQIADGSCGDIV
jgi:hypothetical protein